MVSIKELQKLAGPTAECVGGRIIAVVDGRKVELGGPSGDTNLFALTAEGFALAEAAQAPAPQKRGLKPRKEAAPEPQADPVQEDGKDLQL